MRTSKALVEIEKAIIHLKKAKREISNYSFENQTQSIAYKLLKTALMLTLLM